jgi:hypothetical protein
MKKTQSQNSLNDVISISINSNSNDITSSDQTISQVCNVIRLFFILLYTYMSIKMFYSSSYVQNSFELNVRYIEKKKAAILLCSFACLWI